MCIISKKEKQKYPNGLDNWILFRIFVKQLINKKYEKELV